MPRGGTLDDPYLLDLQAAIPAKARRFDKAIIDAEQAAELARQRGLDALAERIEERPARCRRGEAYREDPRAVPAGLADP